MFDMVTLSTTLSTKVVTLTPDYTEALPPGSKDTNARRQVRR